MHSDRPDGLWPTVVCDASGIALGLAYSGLESLREALTSRRGVYQSRSRGLWNKGGSSGNTQELLRVDVDCDRDALRFMVRQRGAGFCHRQTSTCWGEAGGLSGLEKTLAARRRDSPRGSYTARLWQEPTLLAEKLAEEAAELAAAETQEDVAWEAADLFYFLAVAMQRHGVGLEEMARELDRRALRIRRRSETKVAARETGAGA